MDKDAPDSVTQSTRGSRTFSMMFLAIFWGIGSPQTAFQIAVTVSEKEILTLPTQMHRIMVRNSATVRNKYVRGEKRSRRSRRDFCIATS